MRYRPWKAGGQYAESGRVFWRVCMISREVDMTRVEEIEALHSPGVTD
jgi:hypothetical protein